MILFLISHNMTCEHLFKTLCLLVFKSDFKFKGAFWAQGVQPY